MKTGLIFFTKPPILGYSKTRLSPYLKRDDLLALMRFLIMKNYGAAKEAGLDVFVYQAGQRGKEILEAMLEGPIYLQEGRDLGERMHRAFVSCFEKDYDKLILMGSDIGDIDKELIMEALEVLDDYDVCASPTLDGGYSLIGLKKPCLNLFKDKVYSTDRVFRDLVEAVNDEGLAFKALRSSYDIDDREALIYFMEKCSGLAGVFPSGREKILEELKNER